MRYFETKFLNEAEEFLDKLDPKTTKKIKRQEIKIKTRKPVILFCLVCEKEFLQNKYHPEQKTCSLKCNSKYFRQNNKDDVLRWKRESNARHREHLSSYNTLYKDKLRFSGNRLRALRRDNFSCQNCGYAGPESTDDRSKDVIVHHIDFSGSSKKPNNRVENLQTLCRACHIRLHTHKLK